MKKLNFKSIVCLFLMLNSPIIYLSCMDLKIPCSIKPAACCYEDENDPKVANISKQLRQVYEYIDDNIDNMIKSKGPKKAIEILTPFFVLYSHYFGDRAIQLFINKIIRAIGKRDGMYEIQLQIGKSDAFWESLGSDPLGVTTMYLAKLTDKLLSCECECGCLPCR